MRTPDNELERLVSRHSRSQTNASCFARFATTLLMLSLCRICASTTRDHSVICVVEEPHSLVAVEKRAASKASTTCCTAVFRPFVTLGPTNCTSGESADRVWKPENNEGVAVSEVILGNQSHHRRGSDRELHRPAAEAAWLCALRIAMGMPVGSDLEYVDEVTMDKALPPIGTKSEVVDAKSLN